MHLEFVHVLKALAISVKNMPIKLTFYLTATTTTTTITTTTTTIYYLFTIFYMIFSCKTYAD